MLRANHAAGLAVAAAAIAMTTGGCGWWGRQGFLSDYSRLEPEGFGPSWAPAGALRYCDPAFHQYTRFIIEPVEVRFYADKREVKTSPVILRDLTNYAHGAMVEAFIPRYAAAARPGPRIARLRVAITDLNASSKPLKRAPPKSVASVTLTGATLECEAVDSLTGDQVAAFIQPLEGGRFDLANLERWPDAKAVVNAWAAALRKRVDVARGVANTPAPPVGPVAGAEP